MMVTATLKLHFPSSPVKPEVVAGDGICCSLFFDLCVHHEVGKNEIITLRPEGEECAVDVATLSAHRKTLHPHTHLKPGEIH